MKKIWTFFLFTVFSFTVSGCFCESNRKADDSLHNLYPRLAMWWPSSWEQSADDMARYDWIGWSPDEDETVLASLKAKNPNQLHFTSISVTETGKWDWEGYPDLMKEVPDVWFLTQVGTTLASGIDSLVTDIPVNETKVGEMELFIEGDTVACGSESMKVISVDHSAKTITVERGYVRAAVSHTAGERIAAHITFWPETWVMNLSLQCPLRDVGNGDERWIDWAYRKYLPEIIKKQRDGFLVDRIEYGESWLVDGDTRARSIDADCSNTLVTDEYAAFDASWKTGISALFPKLRNMLGGKYLLSNSFGAYHTLLNGAVFEGQPGNWNETEPDTFEDWKNYILGEDGYLNTSRTGYSPNFSLVETYEIDTYHTNNPYTEPGFVPNYQKMRWGIATALLGDGYFSYEIGTNGHGSLGLMWFDEYDNAGAGRGYLGQPDGDCYEIQDFGGDGKVYRRNYTNGIVLCNPSNQSVTIELENSFKLIKGKQVPSVNTGESVRSVTIASHDGRILLRE